jgi:hypothetical protein
VVAFASVAFLLVVTGCSSTKKWNAQDASTFYGRCLSSAVTQGISNDQAGAICSCELSAYESHGYTLEDVEDNKPPSSIAIDCAQKHGIG